MRQLDTLGHAFRAARENNHGSGAGGWRTADCGLRIENVPEQREEFPGAGDAGAHVFEIDQTDACFHKIVHLEPGAFKKGARGDDVFQSGQFRARQHGGCARGEVQHGGHFAQPPQREDDNRCGVDVGQQQAHTVAAHYCAAQGMRQHVRPHHQLPIGQRLLRRVFEDDMGGMFAGALRHCGEDILRAERHLDIELLPHHLVAQPAGQPRPRAAGADVPQLGRPQCGAEMRGHFGKTFFPARIGGIRQVSGAAQVSRDDFRLRF